MTFPDFIISRALSTLYPISTDLHFQGYFRTHSESNIFLSIIKKEFYSRGYFLYPFFTTLHLEVATYTLANT